jgi:HEAT repeat protein
MRNYRTWRFIIAGVILLSGLALLAGWAYRHHQASKRGEKVRQVLVALESQDAKERQQAIVDLITVAAGGDEAQRAAPALRHALADEDRYVRCLAALALWAVGDVSSTPEIEAALTKEADARIRKILEQALKGLRQRQPFAPTFDEIHQFAPAPTSPR